MGRPIRRLVSLCQIVCLMASLSAGAAQRCSSDTETLLRSPWAAQLGWNISVDMSQWLGVACDPSQGFYKLYVLKHMSVHEYVCCVQHCGEGHMQFELPTFAVLAVLYNHNRHKCVNAQHTVMPCYDDCIQLGQE